MGQKTRMSDDIISEVTRKWRDYGLPGEGGIFGHQRTGSLNGGHIRSLSLLSDLIDSALKHGADAGRRCFRCIFSVRFMNWESLEKLERSESNDLGLRVFVGKQQAIVSSTISSQIRCGMS